MTGSLTVKLHPVWMTGGYRYNVTRNGECIVSLSRDPETDLARAVLARGIKGVVSVLDGKTGKPRTRVNIERAAKLRTVETGNAPRFRTVACAEPQPAGGRASLGVRIPAYAYGSQLGGQHGPEKPATLPQQTQQRATPDCSLLGGKAT
jgi:hypothetical protein